jgi:hypothetical protein
MRKPALFWIGFGLLLLYELASVYFIMPFPGSQEIDSLDLAYFLYRARWVFRILFLFLMLWGWWKGRWKYTWIPPTAIAVCLLLVYMLYDQMAAERIFKQPSKLNMVPASANLVSPDRLVLGVTVDGESRAYPIGFLTYHHQVSDTIAGRPIMVTYCSVCRSGRVFEPMVGGRPEQFRLVGMDHFNAMFEDQRTGSWWRQATGEAVVGKLKGTRLPEMMSWQSSLENWLTSHPNSLVMQADPGFKEQYDSSGNYETGKSRKKLTGTDSLSWKRKSWVVGLSHQGSERAYDWNQLLSQRYVEDTLGGSSVFLVVSRDSSSFYAFEKPGDSVFLRNDTIQWKYHRFRLDGRGIDTAWQLKSVKAYQEFWHSWESFHPQGNQFGRY